ncbi:MAG TPA: outer membrane lipoprotein carrier protein LolA [Spirochaetota bacterium]|nr:outer membrane lipoprotein carrier protein LolA [Spirochaetota bacterium]HQO01300.1 outer membrane lipoprotein carrier protein LolA [Spirochaetota bacterium]
MKKTIILSALTIIALCSVTAYLYAMTGDEALQRFQGRMGSISTMRGTISWTDTSGFMYTGNFKFMAPGRIFVKFSSPSGKILASNGRKLWVYSPSSNICGIQDLGRGRSGGIAGVVSGYSAILLGGGSGYTIKLKNNDRHYSSITLVVDSTFLLKKAIMKTKDGGGMTISLAGVVVGEGMSPGIFDFSPPVSAQTVNNPLNIK